jgi:hypothetical protein
MDAAPSWRPACGLACIMSHGRGFNPGHPETDRSLARTPGRLYSRVRSACQKHRPHPNPPASRCAARSSPSRSQVVPRPHTLYRSTAGSTSASTGSRPVEDQQGCNGGLLWYFQSSGRLSPAVPGEESGRVLRHWRVWGALSKSRSYRWGRRRSRNYAWGSFRKSAG